MSGTRAVWNSTALLVLGRIYGSACTFLILWRLSHALEPAEFGRFTFWMAVFSVLDTWVDFGTGQTTVACTAAQPERLPAVLRAARQLRIAHGLGGFLLIALAAWLGGEQGALWIALAALYPVTHALELSTAAKRNAIDYRVHTLTRALSSTLWIAGTSMLLAWGDVDPTHHLVAIAMGSTIGNIVLHLVLRRDLPVSPERASSWELWRMTLPLGLAALFQQAYFWVDNLYVRAWCGDELLGAYNIGMRVLSVSIMVVLFATGAALPWYTREHARGALAVAVERLAFPLVTLAACGAGLLTPWSAEVLGLFGDHARAAATALPWLLAAVVMIHMGAAVLTALVAVGKRRELLGVSATALGINIFLNTWLVPAYGLQGAAIATFCTEAAVATLGCCLLARIGAAPRLQQARWLAVPLVALVTWWLSHMAHSAWSVA